MPRHYLTLHYPTLTWHMLILRTENKGAPGTDKMEGGISYSKSLKTLSFFIIPSVGQIQ